MQENENLEELSLINLAKQGDDRSLKQIIDQHSGICVSVYKKYTNMSSISGVTRDDIESSKDYIIFNSVKSYDPSRGSKFSTWLANQTRYYCLNSINKNKNISPSDEETIGYLIDKKHFEDFKDNDAIEFKNETVNEIKKILDCISNKKIKKCIEKKYFSGENKTYTIIAEEMNVTVQTVINWHNKFIKLVKQKLNSQNT
mgnify:CR=1 FL=1|jgi:RNA polymerase sigma factor (sigma-70 family)